jgi:predicted Zn-dependent protease with MMP-like domain
VKSAEREEFDRLLEDVFEQLPGYVNEKLEEVPVIVEDEPDEDIRREMGETDLEEPSDLCGLQHGVPLTEKSDFVAEMSAPVIMIFRGPIRRLAGRSHKELRKQIPSCTKSGITSASPKKSFTPWGMAKRAKTPLIPARKLVRSLRKPKHRFFKPVASLMDGEVKGNYGTQERAS